MERKRVPRALGHAWLGRTSSRVCARVHVSGHAEGAHVRPLIRTALDSDSSSFTDKLEYLGTKGQG